jgi:hypothetical protein
MTTWMRKRLMKREFRMKVRKEMRWKAKVLMNWLKIPKEKKNKKMSTRT